MESNSLDVSLLNAELAKEEEVFIANKFLLKIYYIYQWAKAVIFDENANIITHKNCPATKEELRFFILAKIKNNYYNKANI